MTRKSRPIDTTVLSRGQRIAAITLASFALGTPLLGQAQAPAPATQQAAGDKAASEAFKRADANKDGKLSKEEASGTPAIASRFDELDKDRDGSLSLGEFLAGYAK